MKHLDKPALEALARDLKEKTSTVLAEHGLDTHELKQVSFGPVGDEAASFGCQIINGQVVCS